MDNVENFTKSEEIWNAILHGIGSGLAIAALTILVVYASLYGNAWHIVSFSIYGFSLILLFVISTLYHSFPKGKAKDLFEIFDHSAIYLLIAGSYTPFTLLPLRGALGWSFFGVIWGLAIVGIVFKVFWVKRFVIFSTSIYIFMGWMIIFAIKPLMQSIPFISLLFLILGGVAYTFGAIFYIWRKLKYHHAIWHVFVLGGSIFHFFTILFLLDK